MRLPEYPYERYYTNAAIGMAISLHLAIVLAFALLAILFHVKTLRDFMLQGGSLEMHAPPPEEKIEVSLDDLLPPPPTTSPEFIIQMIKPPPQPVVIEKPKPKPKETPKQVTQVPKPHYEMESRLVIGSSGFPHPGYPTRAKLMHISGTVTLSVSFDGSGKAANAEIVGSSGSSVLDSPTRSFILENWHNVAFAGRTETVPVEYDLDGQ